MYYILTYHDVKMLIIDFILKVFIMFINQNLIVPKNVYFSLKTRHLVDVNYIPTYYKNK